ncbi:uncharacterized protein LOC143427852 [Xylocopa sonorina]|uniref:uncharacterized protein LOC143427852 n=1 Tax=Xylocopa sonorina TaxID=1818115 RepID=UPI00403AA436
MGKTRKKAAPGGDERNLYNRRLKATTAPSNTSEHSLHKRQCESEISNRSKLSTLKKKISPGPSKTLKIRRVPKQFGPSKIGRPVASSDKKKLVVPEKSEESTSTKMQPESEETEAKLNPTAQKENTAEEISIDTVDPKHVDHAPSEPVSVTKPEEDVTNKETLAEEKKTEPEEAMTSSDKSKEMEEHEENDLNLRFETEENLVKTEEEKQDDKSLKDENSEKCPSVASVAKDVVQEKEDLQSESQTDTESYSADVLEATTSEVSEVSETASQSDVQKDKGKPEESVAKDISFVSYDPSIMLKDVQIKLNDCLKENSKLFETSSASHSSPSEPPKDASFGKTLRSISGRRSLNRMRYVTLREHRYSPNDSMFVNTSSVSLPQEDSQDFKILRYTTGLSDTIGLSNRNGSPTEKKRKYETEGWNSTKKQKIESENSLLNSSISLLKGLRRPIQVSTPVSEMKFQTDKFELDDESKSASEAKKWCIIM